MGFQLNINYNQGTWGGEIIQYFESDQGQTFLDTFFIQ